MFDIGFSELLLFGVIALIVLGPEKLPKAARTAGQWYAKLRRTISTLQSEIEAEFDLAETRQQMQEELAKIRQTEADMKREMAEMRGNMQAFKHSQNQSLNATHNLDGAHNRDEPKQATPSEFAYAYHQDTNFNQDRTHQDEPLNDCETLNANVAHSANALDNDMMQHVVTRPWENMWFRLGAYDKARRLPAAPRLPNYKADALLHANIAMNVRASPLDAQDKTHIIPSTSLHKQETE